MAKLKLSEHLLDEYKVDKDGSVVLKTEFYEYDSGEKYGKIKIPSDQIFVSAFKSKHNRNEINRCAKKISHAMLMKIKRDHNIRLTRPDIIRRPDEEQDLWGYCIVDVIDSDSYGDGEVHSETLHRNFWAYAFTMMVKRAQDRAICNEIGLYSEGFYSEYEDLGEDEIKAVTNVIDYDDVKRDAAKDEEEDTEDKKPDRKTRDKKKTEDKEEKPARKRRTKKETPTPEAEEKGYHDGGDNSDPDDPEADNLDDREFTINKIKLLSDFMQLNTEEMTFHSLLEGDADVNNLDDLKDLKDSTLDKILDHFVEQMEKEDLLEMLHNVLRQYKTDEKWNMAKFREEIADIIGEDDPEDVEVDKLSVNGLFHIINEWDLWDSYEG